jgi:hypothetical protein
MLHIRPAGFAYRSHVEAVTQGYESLFVGAKSVSQRRTFSQALILSSAAVLLLMLFDEGCESQFLKATTHSARSIWAGDSLPGK